MIDYTVKIKDMYIASSRVTKGVVVITVVSGFFRGRHELDFLWIFFIGFLADTNPSQFSL